jgi:hypothetical protein
VWFDRFIVRYGTGREVGKWADNCIIADAAVMQYHIRSDAAVFADNGIA